MKIYLDHNIFIQIKDEVENFKKVEEYNNFLKNIKNLDIYYTYAHCEEIARLKDKKEVLLKYFREITKNKEILNSSFYDGNSVSSKFIFIEEDIQNCLNRVEKTKNYNQDMYNKLEMLHEKELETRSNKIFSGKQNFFLEFKDDFKEYLIELLKNMALENKKIKEILPIVEKKDYSYSTPDNITYYKLIHSIISCYPQRKNWIKNLIKLCENKNQDQALLNFQKKIKMYHNSFSIMEFLVEILMKFIYTFKFATDKNAISKTFDVTHIISASQCDIFISADKKMVKKCEEIYSLLAISTKVKLFSFNEGKFFEDLQNYLKF